MKIAKVIIGAFAGVLLMSGCMTEVPIKQRATEERIKLVGNSSFSIELLNAKTMINDEGLLTVDASVLLSRTGFFRWVFAGDPQVTVWYHFTWIDSQGNSPTPVQREMSVLPGNILDFHGVAPEEKYINYHLTISLEGPAGSDDEIKKNKQELKKTYIKDGKVKPAGRSQAKRTNPKAKKAAAKPAAQPAKPAAKPAAEAEAKPVAKPTAKPAAQPAKPAAKPAAKSEAKPESKQQKLTEPFN